MAWNDITTNWDQEWQFNWDQWTVDPVQVGAAAPGTNIESVEQIQDPRPIKIREEVEQVPPFWIIEPYNCWNQNKKTKADILREQQIYEEFLARFLSEHKR